MQAEPAFLSTAVPGRLDLPHNATSKTNMQTSENRRAPGFWRRYLKAVKDIMQEKPDRPRTTPLPRSLGRSDCFRYRLHGLVVESAIKIPNLDPLPTSELSEAIVENGPVPRNLADCVEHGARFQVSPSGLHIWMDQVARYAVTGGNEIRIEPLADLANGKAGELLLSIPTAALLLQRSLIVLHAAAVATPQGAILIVGRSVAGKSALATWLVQRGIPFMSDDLCSVSLGADGSPSVSSGPSRIRLLPEVADVILRKQAPRSGANDMLRKISVEFDGLHCKERLPLRRIYLIDIGNVASDRLSPVTAASDRWEILMQHTYGKQLLRPMGLHESYGEQVQQLVQKIPILQYMRPKAANTLGELGALILKDIRK